MNKLKAFWAQLPPKLQMLIVCVGSAFITTAGHAFSEQWCFTAYCLKHYAASGVAAAIAAGRAFYMIPNNGTKPPEKPAPPASA